LEKNAERRRYKMESERKKKIKELLPLPPDELKRSFSSHLKDIRLYGTMKTMEESPALLSQIIGRLVELDSAEFANKVPQSMDMFMDLLWEGIALVTSENEHFASIIRGTRDLSVNLEASDSPLRSHFQIRKGILSGGSGMLHFKDQDLRYLGPTETLLKALAGDLAWGKLTREGHPGLMPMMRPVFQGIGNIIRGNLYEA